MMNKKLSIIVLAKQVPDTRMAGKDAMNPDGTINRAALPAIFNPEDKNALEQALQLKEMCPGSQITIITMGPKRALNIVREGLFHGVDKGYLLTDALFAGADTLATSYALAKAIKKIGKFDIIFCGRQAIDGDTAQVGPQVAEKLGIPQVTYAEQIVNVKKDRITIKRVFTGGVETVSAPIPLVVTVNSSAAECRPKNAKLVMANKNCNVTAWSVADIGADPAKCGLSGSPTKVKTINSISFQAKECERFGDCDADILSLVSKLLSNHTIG